MKRWVRHAMVVLSWMGIMSADSALAGSVLPMDLPSLADHAGQVIVGTVASVDARWAANPRRIESVITWEGVTYLKGALLDSTDRFTLIVPGGRVGDKAMQLCCAPTFVAGQKWLLFLLPRYHNFPVVGLYQGAFLIEADERGVERLARTRHGITRAVVGLDASGMVRLAGHVESSSRVHLRAATGLRIVTPSDDARATSKPAMSLDSFIKTLRPILDRSMVHPLTASAGQPWHAARKAVPLVTVSPRQGASKNRSATATENRRPGLVGRISAPRRTQPHPVEIHP